MAAPAKLPAAQAPAWLRALPLAGAGLVLGIVLVLGWLFATGSTQLVGSVGAVTALLYAGKEGGIPIGMSLGGHPVLMGALVLVADVALTLLLFPLVLTSLDSVERRQGFLGRVLKGARRSADRHRALVDRYGTAGLFVFMLVPFAFNGPLVGAVLGRLAGLSPLRSLATVLAAIGTTTAVWTALYAYGFREMGIDPRLPALLSILVAAAMVGTSLYRAWRERDEPEPAALPAAAP